MERKKTTIKNSELNPFDYEYRDLKWEIVPTNKNSLLDFFQEYIEKYVKWEYKK